ncbi:OmpA family protein [Volucribacter amazonae]|uniref:OmpA-like domain-containing protein n=1 Tax=Volucribacter amazonae TaxID=256731 RepID=A0A9X4PEU2_9PAST|nr:OmpA family protein [Volucribacter amazonae]MDG6896281.1 hypothetical protein [Volucribacter amazonae]
MLDLAHWTFRETRSTGITEYLTQQALLAEQAALAQRSARLFTPAMPGYPRLELPQRQQLRQLAVQKGANCAMQALACADVAILGLEYETAEDYGNYSQHGVYFQQQADQYLKQVEQGIAQCAAPPQQMQLNADALFRFNQWQFNQILTQGKQDLQQFAQQVAKSGQKVQRIEITGFTDRLGTAAYNQRLSQRRAETVARYLKQAWQKQGLDTKSMQFVAQGKGSQTPLVQCQQKNRQALKACLQPNRRVEIRLQYQTNP